MGEKKKRNNPFKLRWKKVREKCVDFFGHLCFFCRWIIMNGRKKKHPFKCRKVRDVIATMGLLVTLLKRKREAKCKSFWAKSGSRLWFCGKKSQLQWRVQNHLWSLLTKWSWVQSHWLRNDSKEDCACFCRIS